jgi:hypothetical protein
MNDIRLKPAVRRTVFIEEINSSNCHIMSSDQTEVQLKMKKE